MRLNGLGKSVFPVQGRAEDFMDTDAQLVIANIHYDVMKHLVRMKGFLRKKWFILSGLLRNQARDIEYRLLKERIKIIEKRDHDGIWHTFLGKTL